MPLVLANRVQETSTTTGTGTLTLDGAVLGYQTFSAGIGSGNTCYYAITSSTGAWEVGIGTVGTGTLARTTLLSSSTGSLVSFTGTLNVYVTYPSEKSVNLDAANVMTGYPITVKDNVFTLQDDTDPTKQAQFQLSSINTGTTYTYTLPNSSGILAGTNIAQNWTSAQTFVAGSNTLGSSAGVTTTGVGTGATTTGLTKTVNIGTGGLSGSTTAITVGSLNGSTTTMLGSTVIGGVAGSQSLQVNSVASAVDYLEVLGNSGGYPRLSAQGASTNVSIVYGTKGTGNHNFTTSASQFNQFVVNHTASAVNQLNVSGATTGAPIILSAQGSDTNVSLAYAPKGTGRHTFFSNSGTQFVVGNTASAVNYAQTDGAATGASPTLSAQGSDTNISLNLQSKGTGAVALKASYTTFQVIDDASPSTGGITHVGRQSGFGRQSLRSTDALALCTFSGNPLNLITGGSSTFDGQIQVQIQNTASAVNYLNLTGSATNAVVTTNAPTISAQGSDTNINLKLATKGTGVLQFGTYTAGALSSTGYITITDAGGTSRRLLVG